MQKTKKKLKRKLKKRDKPLAVSTKKEMFPATDTGGKGGRKKGDKTCFANFKGRAGINSFRERPQDAGAKKGFRPWNKIIEKVMPEDRMVIFKDAKILVDLNAHDEKAKKPDYRLTGKTATVQIELTNQEYVILNLVRLSTKSNAAAVQAAKAIIDYSGGIRKVDVNLDGFFERITISDEHN